MTRFEFGYNLFYELHFIDFASCTLVYNQIVMRGQRTKMMLQEYYEIKRMFELPLKIRLYFSTLEDLIDKKNFSDISKQQIVDHLLLKAFLNQSEEEKIAFLLQMIKSLKQYYEKEDQPMLSERKGEPMQSTINNIETSCQLETISFKLSLWINAKFKFDKLRRMVTISNKRRNILLHLDNYLIRNSKKNKNTIVFQAISKEVSEEYAKISLYFQEEIYCKIHQEMFECVCEIRKEQLLHIVKKGQEQGESDKGVSQVHHDKSLVFLSSEQITFYLKYKTHICQRLQVGGFSFKNIYIKNIDEICVKIDRSSKIDKIFKLQFQIKKGLMELKKDFLVNLQSKYKYRLSSTILQQFSKKYRAVYDRYLINNKIYEQISIKEQNNSQKQQIFFSKGVQNIMTGNYIQFVLVKAKPTEKTDVNKIVMIVSLILGKDINLEVATAFLLEFKDMMFKKESEQQQMEQNKQNQNEAEDDFYTIVSHNQMQEQLYEVEQSDQNSDGKYNAELDLKKQKQTLNQSHLKHHYQINPFDLEEEILKTKILKEHFLFKQWKRCKNGGVVCINQEMLVQQKKMIKKILANIGSNLHKIVKSGGVLNISLPVNIFKKQSHLQSIAMNFSYAPLLLDRFQNQQAQHLDTFQRFKYAVLFTISVSNLGISSEKPFNPILGQTLQCWVGGCPLYLQQISHHPPIASYYFVGRGYKIQGQIDPKIGMGLNSGKCWSEKPNYITFDDGTKICLIYSKMVIKGLIFGDREFHFQDRIYVYDQKNHYFAEIFFGPRKKAYMSKGDPEDYIHGKLYRTTSAYLPKFKQKIPPIYPTKDDIAKQLCSVEGIWNQNIKFDSTQYINFSTELPYKLQYQQKPLPSNSTFRKDLSLYIQGDIEKAQQQKQIMQQIQRRDRKLRETGGKK